MGSHIKASGLSPDLCKLCSETKGVERAVSLEAVARGSVCVRGYYRGDIYTTYLKMDPLALNMQELRQGQ